MMISDRQINECLLKLNQSPLGARSANLTTNFRDSVYIWYKYDTLSIVNSIFILFLYCPSPILSPST